MSDSRRCPAISDAELLPRVNVLGVGLSPLNLDLAIRAVDRALAEKHKGYVCVTDVNAVSEAQKDPAFRRILNESFLTTPDGMPMVWMGRVQGVRHMDRVYGPDLMLRVLGLSEERGYTQFLYGGGEGVAQQLEAALQKRFPRLRIVGTFSPPFRPLTRVEEQALEDEVRRASPDILWVGLSTPKQERFMSEYWQRLDATLFFGVGAAFDFHTGRVRQAPRWIQRSGFEWLFRLANEPRRLWRRYLTNNPLFVLRVLGQLSGLRRYSLE